MRPAKENVATRKGRARGGKLFVFPHLTLVIKAESENQSQEEANASHP